MPVTEDRQPNRIPSLDGLRAISIVLVFIGHLAGTRHFLPSDTVARAGDLGNLGVRMFFVISGFLITWLLLAEHRKNDRISLKAFYMRRVLRIFPAFYVFIAVVGLLAYLGVVDNDRRDFVHALTYTMNYEGPTDHFSLRHLWSLSVEEQYYFLWPATLALLGAGRASFALGGVLLFVPVLRIVLYHLLPGYDAYVMMTFESVCDALASGALLAIVLPRLRERRWFARLIASPAMPLLFVAVFLANRMVDHPHFFWFVCIPFMNVAIALLVARYVGHPELPLARVLNSRALVAVGTISYSLYLWQQLFLVQWRPTESVLRVFPVNALAAVTCAVLSYKLVEQPFLRLKHRFEPSRAPAPAPVAPEIADEPIPLLTPDVGPRLTPDTPTA